MACGEYVIPPLGYPGCYPPAIPTDVGRRIVRVSVPGLQGPPGETGALGYSTRTCASLGAFETKALENLRPEKGAQPGDQVANDRGQLFLITAVTETRILAPRMATSSSRRRSSARSSLRATSAQKAATTLAAYTLARRFTSRRRLKRETEQRTAPVRI